jgi:cell division septation protein DedD
MSTMLHHLVLILLAAIWPAFAFPGAAFNRRARTPEIRARESESNDNIPKMEGFNITLSPKKWQPILVKSFDRQTTLTLTTTLTISDHATAFTIKPSDTAVEAATFTTTSSGHALTYLCYPTLATAAGTTKTKCIKDTKTTLGVIDIGSVSATPNPTGFAVGSQTLTPGGVVTVGTHYLSLGPSGGLIIDGSSTHINSPITTTQPGGASSTPVTSPTRKHTPTSKTRTSTHKPSTKTSTKPTSTDPTTKNTKTTTTSTKPSYTSTKHPTTSTKHATPSTKPTTTSTKPTPKPSHTDEILTIGSLTVTADPTGFQFGSTTLTPGGTITVGTQTVSLETGGGDVIIGGTTVPLTATTGTSSTRSWTTLSDESTAGLYGIVTLPGFETLTTPTIITTQYIESKTKTTTGPIYVGTGGIVLQS